MSVHQVPQRQCKRVIGKNPSNLGTQTFLLSMFRGKTHKVFLTGFPNYQMRKMLAGNIDCRLSAEQGLAEAQYNLGLM